MHPDESRVTALAWLSVALIGCSMFNTNVDAADVGANFRTSVAVKEPVAVLTQVIQADFDALDNGGQRIDNVALSSAEVNSFDGPAPGFYMLNWDQFEVATKWELLEQRVLSKKLVEIPVRFRIVGRTKGVKAKEMGISGNPSPENRVIVYRITRSSKGWKIINPPMPIIGLESLMNFYKNELKETSKAITTLEGKSLKPYTNLVTARELAILRLNDLEVLEVKSK